MSDEEKAEVVETEVMTEGDDKALELRAPDVPVTVEELSARREVGLEIVQARADILEKLMTASIRRTDPADWLLFKDRHGQAVGYLQDCGCDRVADLWGISISNISEPRKEDVGEGVFMYSMTGDGHCRVTDRRVFGIEGARASDEDFCRDETRPGMKALLVRKAARANLDGSIVRELAGLKSVPTELLDAAWAGTGKSSSRCRKGKGFGSGKDRDAEKVAEEGVDAKVQKLDEEILRLASGDREKAKDICRQITANPDKKFKGFDSIRRCTQMWQVEKAEKNLAFYKETEMSEEGDG